MGIEQRAFDVAGFNVESFSEIPDQDQKARPLFEIEAYST